MNSIYHILNGDSLKAQFPGQISGELIVARECLVDGDVEGDSLDELFETRANFMSSSYPECTKKEYYQKSVTEIEKITKIPEGSKVFLWFEEDLFCQVNLWFVASLIKEKSTLVTLVLPDGDIQYGFGGMSQEALEQAYADKLTLESATITKLSDLWTCYQSSDWEGLERKAFDFGATLPFVSRAVEAQLARVNSHRPQQSLLKIVSELGTTDFGKVFHEFNCRESIYGFGDLQVKRLLDEVIKDNHIEKA